MDNLTRREAALLAGASAAMAIAGGAPVNELCFMTAADLVRKLRAKELSAREVMRAHLDQIERVNPKVNAIVTLVAEQALKNAAAADEAIAHGAVLGPLHGLPVAHKDLNETKGIRTTFGSPIFKDNIPDHDAIVVERAHAAGAITLGKTNTPEFGAGSQTFNQVFGATHNPWDLTKTCGGSSGGAAVSLACGMVPIADGSDMGGSLRNPAAFCGVVGFRPSPGRVPAQSPTAAWSPLSVSGPMARNVTDLALFLSALAGSDPRSPLSINEPGAQFARPLGRMFKGTRVAWARNLGDAVFDPRVRQVVDAQRKRFEDLGCIVEEAEPDLTGADESFKTLRALSFQASYAEFVRTKRSLVKDTVIEEVERGARITGPQVAHAEMLRSRLFDRMRVFTQRYEFLVLPVTQVPPFDVNQPYPTEIGGVKMTSYIDWMKSCYYISILGNPAISIPAGLTPEGLPVGLQIVGRYRDDWGVLQMAHAVEQPWRNPPTS